MFNPYPWSYSSLSHFETCPYKFQQERITRSVKKQQGEAAKAGDTYHKEIEAFYKEGKPYMLTPVSYQQAAAEELKDKSIVHCQFEQELAITRDLQPAEYNDPSAWYRCKIDLTCYRPPEESAYLSDWKTGKPDIHSLQLAANALCFFAKHEQVQRITTKFVWLKYKSSTSGFVWRDHMSEIADKFHRRVIKIEQAVKDDYFPKTPSGLCKKYCQVTSCEFCGVGGYAR